MLEGTVFWPSFYSYCHSALFASVDASGKIAYYCKRRAVLRVCVSLQSCVIFATLWTVARQGPLSRQEYLSVLPCCSPEDLPSPGIEPASLTSTCIHWSLSSPTGGGLAQMQTDSAGPRLVMVQQGLALFRSDEYLSLTPGADLCR